MSKSPIIGSAVFRIAVAVAISAIAWKVAAMRGWGTKGNINTIACSYATSDSNPNAAELQSRGKCAYLRDGQVFLSASALRELPFSSRGLASVFAENTGWLFVKRDGSTIRTIAFDNGPDDFVEGLARYTTGEKVGFIDESGAVVISAGFDFVFPFHKGYAVVCNGGEKKSDGEHVSLKGGLWGCIDKSGKIVAPVEHSENDMHEKMLRLYQASGH